MEQRRSRRIDASAPWPLGVGSGRGLAALLTCAVLALSGVLLSALGASAAQASASPDATTDPASVRWTVKPADGDGADGRRRIETSADPGTTVQEYMAVKNLSDVEATFTLSAADGLFNQNGRFDMLPADQESVDAGTWIELPSSVSVPARTTVVVPFTIAVPDKATPGDHVAGVAAAFLSDAGNLQVVSRVGFRVAIDVGGEVTPGLEAEVTGVEYHASWNPFSPGTLEIRYSLANDGNVRLGGSGVVSASALFGSLSADSEFEVEDVSPGQTSEGSVVIEGVWPGVWDTAEFTLTPRAVEGREAVSQPQLERSIGFWAVPWPQLILVALVSGVVVGAVLHARLRRRRDEPTITESPQDEKELNPCVELPVLPPSA